MGLLRHFSILVSPMLFENVASFNNGLQIAKSAQQDAKAWPLLDPWKYDEPQLWLPLLLQCRVR